MKIARAFGFALAAVGLSLAGCVVAPPGYQAYQGYDSYGQPVYVQGPPVVVQPPAVSIGIGGFFRGGPRRGYWGGGYWR